jgi:flagellar motility protein MotE (MotC chaperone)
MNRRDRDIIRAALAARVEALDNLVGPGGTPRDEDAAAERMRVIEMVAEMDREDAAEALELLPAIIASA